MNSGTFDADAYLLQKLEEGDRASFAALYEKYWEQAYSAAYKRLQNKELCKDVVQEVFMNIWANHAITHISNFPAYLHVAIRNQVIKQVLKNKPIVPFLQNLEVMDHGEGHPESNLISKEFYRSFEQHIANLPPKRQQIFRLRYNEDLTTKDIADQLNLSRKTVQNQLGKAIEQLRVSILQIFMLVTLWLLLFT